MATYRCALLDAAQQVRTEEQFESEHEVDALIRAMNMLGDQTRCHFAEVWCGSRIIARLPKDMVAVGQTRPAPRACA